MKKDDSTLHIAGPCDRPNPNPDLKPSNVVESIGGMTRLRIPVDRVLDGAKDLLDEVVIIGYEKDSGKIFFASTLPDGGDVLWLLEKAKQVLMSV